VPERDSSRNADATNDQALTTAVYGIVGVLLFVLGGTMLAKVGVDSNPNLLRASGLVVIGAGFYATVVGAIAHGIRLARR
jgi:hypothetical protein